MSNFVTAMRLSNLSEKSKQAEINQVDPSWRRTFGNQI